MNKISYILCIWLIGLILHKQVDALIAPDTTKRCQTLRADKLLKGRCRDMHLKEIPQQLSSGLELLDVSFNRIRKLNKTSFQRYESLRYLLLYENMIQTIEENTFSYLTNLEEIDLSNNALLTIPLEIFNLPSLRNLYVDSNNLIYFINDLQSLTKPINAPLEYLNIADCGLEEIPNLGILPYLWHLNATQNPLRNISVDSFPAMCHLKSIHLENTKIPKCACHTIVHYLKSRQLNVTDSITCDIRDVYSCQDLLYKVNNMEDYEMCTFLRTTQKTRTTWILIVACIGGGIILLICVWFMFYRCCKRKKSTKNQSKCKQEEVINQELLKNPLK